MGVFNNIQRFKTFDISEYIRNFQRQIQTGLKLDANNNYDIQQKRLTNVGEGVDNDDAKLGCQQNRIQLMSYCLMEEIMIGDLDLRGNKILFYLEKLIWIKN